MKFTPLSILEILFQLLGVQLSVKLEMKSNHRIRRITPKKFSAFDSSTVSKMAEAKK